MGSGQYHGSEPAHGAASSLAQRVDHPPVLTRTHHRPRSLRDVTDRPTGDGGPRSGDLIGDLGGRRGPELPDHRPHNIPCHRRRRGPAVRGCASRSPSPSGLRRGATRPPAGGWLRRRHRIASGAPFPSPARSGTNREGSGFTEKSDPLDELRPQPQILLLGLRQSLSEGDHLIHEAPEARQEVLGCAAHRLDIHRTPPARRADRLTTSRHRGTSCGRKYMFTPHRLSPQRHRYGVQGCGIIMQSSASCSLCGRGRRFPVGNRYAARVRGRGPLDPLSSLAIAAPSLA